MVVTGPEAAPGRRAGYLERRVFELEEALAEAERRLRARAEQDAIRELEFASIELALDLKDAYIARLETDQGKLHAEANELITSRAAIFNELERVRGEVAELGAFADAVRKRRAYRLVDAVAGAARAPLRLARRLARTLRGGGR